ncbi:TPA: ATP-binding protein [Campylobacter jejuni]|nr:ATP-binding protein [Campylobacter jejuni]EAI2123165.1 ATP-binding protein [Campylobacter jejuni]EAI2775180.1 ATP-binding protein [Campylobacter jejuni]ECK8481281.1 ATP-binding protein [Campylobacter jejuni]ECL2501585.1 ATP-binding protein [Campylobacter jejuni]
MSKIIPFREEIFHQINQILESQKAFIFLWGKSGSGKSVLLQRLAKKYNVDFINENFKDQSFLKEKIEFLISRGQSLIILDEVGMYDYAMLESIRIYSDSISFVLSSHKKLNILKKEHFKSRLSACFELKNISLLELDGYIKLKFGMNFSNKCLKFLQKISQGNLRYIDKTLKSFYEINSFFDKNKSQEYILKLSALENGLLR